MQCKHITESVWLIGLFCKHLCLVMHIFYPITLLLFRNLWKYTKTILYFFINCTNLTNLFQSRADYVLLHLFTCIIRFILFTTIGNFLFVGKFLLTSKRTSGSIQFTQQWVLCKCIRTYTGYSPSSIAWSYILIRINSNLFDNFQLDFFCIGLCLLEKKNEQVWWKI